MGAGYTGLRWTRTTWLSIVWATRLSIWGAVMTPDTIPAHADAALTHHTAAVNGTELHYVAAGGSGSPVLLVHGFPESWWAFHKLVPLLARHHRVFAVDLRGFGDSAVADADFTSATAAEDLHRLI